MNDTRKEFLKSQLRFYFDLAQTQTGVLKAHNLARANAYYMELKSINKKEGVKNEY